MYCGGVRLRVVDGFQAEKQCPTISLGSTSLDTLRRPSQIQFLFRRGEGGSPGLDGGEDP